MSARPSYDKDLLLRLKMEHPDWTDGRVAEALTADNEARFRQANESDVRQRQPHWDDAAVAAEVDKRVRRYPPRTVTASMVQSAVFRNRAKWAALGFTLPKVPRRSQYIRQLMQLRGYRTLSSEENARSVPLKRLRYVERLALGLKVPDVEKAKARSWEAEMRRNRTVVDLVDGRALVRAAHWWELDADGNLISLTAQPVPDDPNIANMEPNLEDAVERAIWEREGLNAEAKVRLILEVRTASLIDLLDEPEKSPAEKIPNGQTAG